MEMDRETISRRLKAARWLAGTGRNGKGTLVPLPAAELARHELLVRNGITASRIEEIEQERVDARPMELEKIGLALGVSEGWFDVGERGRVSDEQLRRAAELLGPQLLAAARAVQQAQAQEQADTDERDRLGEAGEGGAG